MARPLLALAFVFALVVIGAGALILRSGRDVAPLAANPSAEALSAPAAGTDAGEPETEAESGAQTAAIDPSKAGAASPTPPAEAPATSLAPADEAAVTPGAPVETKAPSATDAGEIATAPASEPAEPATPAPAEAESETAALPAFDVVRVEPDGSALIAGRAEPGAAVEILSAGQVIASAVADAEGAFIAIPDAPLAPGSHGLSLRVAGQDTPSGPQREVTVAALPESAAAESGTAETGAPPTVAAEPRLPAEEEQQIAAAEPEEAPLPQSQPSQGSKTAIEAGSPPATSTEAEPPAEEQVVTAEPGDASTTPSQLPPASRETAEVTADELAALTPSAPTTAESAEERSGAEPSEPGSVHSADADADVSVTRPDTVEEEPTSGAPDNVSNPAAAEGDDTPQPTSVAPAESASGTEDSDDAVVETDVGTTKDVAPPPQAPRSDEEIAGLQAPLPLTEGGGEGSGGGSQSSPAPAVSATATGSAEDSRPASGDPAAAVEPNTPSAGTDDKPPPGSPEIAELAPPSQLAGNADQTGVAPSFSPKPEAADLARAEAPEAQKVLGDEPAPPAETAQSGDASAPKAAATPGLADLQYSPVLPRFESGQPGQPEASAPANPTEAAPEGESEAGTKQIAATSESETAPPEERLTVPRLTVEAAPREEGVHVSAKAAALPPALAAPQISIKAAEVENDQLYVAGEAKPGSIVRLMADNIVIAEVETGNGGHWLVEAQKDIPVGKVTLRADIVGADATTPTLRAELRFTRYADGVVLEPVIAATGGDSAETTLDARLPPPALVIIRRGDNLWRISRRNYGRGIRYKSIFAANRDQIRNPHRIYPGQVFMVPTRDRSWTSASN